MSWKENALMFWSDDSGNFHKITDHGRAPLTQTIERIEQKSRMADGTLRRYTIAKKRSWSTSWTTLPSTNAIAGGMHTVDGGWSGSQMENYYNSQDGSFLMILRKGSAINKVAPSVNNMILPYEDDDFYVARVMFSDFSKDIVRRGPASDLWEVSVTLEEV